MLVTERRKEDKFIRWGHISAKSERMDILETDAYDRRQRRNMVRKNYLLFRIENSPIIKYNCLNPSVSLS